MRFSVFTVIALSFFVQIAAAQTPQQLEMLKQKNGGNSVGRVDPTYPVYLNEKGELVIPENKNPMALELKNGMKILAPMAKTDAEILATRSGPNPKLVRQLNQEQAKKYAEYLVQDRIFLTITNKRITTTPSGLKYCQMRMNVKNNTPRYLEKIRVTYGWGNTKTSVTFSNIGVMEGGSHNMALAGSVCNDLKNVEYDVDTCSMEGLTEEQCQIRIAKM